MWYDNSEQLSGSYAENPQFDWQKLPEQRKSDIFFATNTPGCHRKHVSQRKVFRAANGENTVGNFPEKGDNTMKLKENLKRFWTLDVHNHEGFTLVELIIVIAILAILSTGAIAGYSAYIKQANMTADEALAAEIKNALLLAMYSGELTSGDYVVIKQGETAAWGNSETENDVDSTIYRALAAAYGSGWENVLRLKWDGWTVGVTGDAEKMDMVYDSNFSPTKMDKLLDQLQGVVGDAAEYLGGGSINVSAEIATLMQQNGFDI
jgi:prepilin-type N-terminal cleavage/methylation domain-containing protein